MDRLAALVAAGRIEIVGGAYYEPILTMIPPRDRVGQIRSYAEWLSDRFSTPVNGMWIPERVWEQSLTSDLAEAGVRYTLLDDFHFKNAGLHEDELHGYYITEDDGQLLSVFPGSERLRYTIPFQEPQETIDYLRPIAEQQPGAVVVFGDDGEKFGVWPGTKEHVYDHGWLRRFLDALVENRSWLSVVTPTEALDQVPPIGKVYIPEGSYREMTEWALPTERLKEFNPAQTPLGTRKPLARSRPVRPRRLLAKLQSEVSRNQRNVRPHADGQPPAARAHRRQPLTPTPVRTATATKRTGRFSDQSLIDQARAELYRGQCNCGYWHGAFGGAYLPHLRNAVFQHLISADNLLDAAAQAAAWPKATKPGSSSRPTITTSTPAPKFASPATGCSRSSPRRTAATCTSSTSARSATTCSPRSRAAKRRITTRSAPANASRPATSPAFTTASSSSKRTSINGCNSIAHRRKSLVDHFYPIERFRRSGRRRPVRRAGRFRRRRRSKPSCGATRLACKCSSRATAASAVGRCESPKASRWKPAARTLEIAYLLEGLPPGETGPLRRRVQLRRSARRLRRPLLPRRPPQLARPARLAARSQDVDYLGLTDEWLGIDVELHSDQPMHVWTFPIETVSQSEGGFELVHQSVVVHPHWYIRSRQRWPLGHDDDAAIDTSLAEKRPSVSPKPSLPSRRRLSSLT